MAVLLWLVDQLNASVGQAQVNSGVVSLTYIDNSSPRPGHLLDFYLTQAEVWLISDDMIIFTQNISTV